jgi:ankyrin repeat protein
MVVTRSKKDKFVKLLQIQDPTTYDEKVVHERNVRELINDLLAIGFLINIDKLCYKNPNGQTFTAPALCIAALCGSLIATEILAENGCIWWVSDNEGSFPLHLAAKNGHFELIKYIVEKEEAHIMLTNKDKHKASKVARMNGHIEVAEFLEQKEKDFIERNFGSMFEAGRIVRSRSRAY